MVSLFSVDSWWNRGCRRAWRERMFTRQQVVSCRVVTRQPTLQKKTAPSRSPNPQWQPPPVDSYRLNVCRTDQSFCWWIPIFFFFRRTDQNAATKVRSIFPGSKIIKKWIWLMSMKMVFAAPPHFAFVVIVTIAIVRRVVIVKTWVHAAEWQDPAHVDNASRCWAIRSMTATNLCCCRICNWRDLGLSKPSEEKMPPFLVGAGFAYWSCCCCSRCCSRLRRRRRFPFSCFFCLTPSFFVVKIGCTCISMRGCYIQFRYRVDWNVSGRCWLRICFWRGGISEWISEFFSVRPWYRMGKLFLKSMKVKLLPQWIII